MSRKMKVNKKLLPMKGHYFFFNAGTAPLVPYLSTYARQLGFSSATVGLIYTVLPIFGLIAKPSFGVIADRFKIQKPLFIFFQVLIILTFWAIYFIPKNIPSVTVSMDLDSGPAMLKSCYQNYEQIDDCKINSLGNLGNQTSMCNMNCNMSSPQMWKTVCEHWHIPQYCDSSTDSIHYSAYISHVTMKNDSCAYLSAQNVTMHGNTHTTKCEANDDIIQPCSLNCTNQRLSAAIGSKKSNMTCVNGNTNYQLCTDNAPDLEKFSTESLNSDCQVSCDLYPAMPWRLMEMCTSWGTDVNSNCFPRTRDGESYPANLSFVSTILLSTTISNQECVLVDVESIRLPDGSVYYSNSDRRSRRQAEIDMSYPICEVSCDNSKINEIFQEASESRNNKDESQYTTMFWFFFILMIINWMGQAVVVTFADAICFNLLGIDVSDYGKQRLWGSVGWGIFSLLTGTLIDYLSKGAYKDHTVAFILMFVFMSGDVIVSNFLKVESTTVSVSILADVGSLLSSLQTCMFMLWTIAVGLCTGLLWQFQFWLLEDISKLTCDGSDYIKTLQGLVSAIQMFCGEIPFLFISGYVLKVLGHVNTMSLVLFAFGLRYILYSYLTNPWLVLPIEMFQGITFGMFYPTMTSYATIVSPPGTETTVQGLVGAIFEGVGTSLGSFIGGRLYETHGGWNTFRWFGVGSIVCGCLHVIAQFIFKGKFRHIGLSQAKRRPLLNKGLL